MHGDGGANGEGNEETVGMISPPYIPNPIDTSGIKLSEEQLKDFSNYWTTESSNLLGF